MIWAILWLAFATGAALGLARRKVWTLFPAIIISSVIVVLVGSGLGLRWGEIAFLLVGVVTLVQVAYLIGTVLSESPRRSHISDHLPDEEELLRIVRTSIADELPGYFVPPLNDLTPQLRNKLALLEAHGD